MTKRRHLIIKIALLLFVVILFGSCRKTESFKKEGELIFVTGSSEQKKINIEIADIKHKRNIGLMNRKYLEKNNGMLFIYDTSYKRFFWMKNTYIPLDIIYVDNKFHVVSIQENTEPLLEKKYPSYKKAMYVVEVNAGFCNMHNIKVGDSISYKRI